MCVQKESHCLYENQVKFFGKKWIKLICFKHTIELGEEVDFKN